MQQGDARCHGKSSIGCCSPSCRSWSSSGCCRSSRGRKRSRSRSRRLRRPFPREQLKAAIDKLGNLDYATRTNASRLVRRTPAAQAVPALLQAVAEHGDGYVRYRALVLLTGFNDPRTKDAMRESMASPNDRLRTVAYSFFEHNPDPAMVPALIARAREGTGRVRPSGARPRARGSRRRTLVRSRCSFATWRAARTSSAARSSRRWATTRPSTRSTRSRPSPSSMARCRTIRRLRSDASGTSGRSRRWRVFRGRRPRPRQPAIAAAICLLGVNCDSHEPYLIETLKFGDKNPGFQELLRAAASGPGGVGHQRPSHRRDGAARCRHPLARSDPGAGRSGACRGGAAQHAADAADSRDSAPTAPPRSAWSRKASTCSKKTWTRSGSSPSSAGPTGPPPKGRRRKGSCSR